MRGVSRKSWNVRALASMAGVLVASMGSVAIAQDGALSGPVVEDRTPPGMEKTFGQAMASNRMVVRESIPMARFKAMLTALDGELALTEDQKRAAKEVETQWQQQTAAYYGEHLSSLEAVQAMLPEDEAKRLEGTLRSARRAIEQGWKVEVAPSDLGELADPMGGEMRGGGRDGREMRMRGDGGDVAVDEMRGEQSMADQEQALQDADDARGLLQRIRRGVPTPLEPQTKVWNLLTEGQQTAMTASIEAFRVEERARREQREMERVAQNTGGQPGQTLMERNKLLEEAAKTGELPDAVMDRLPDGVRERLAGLDGDERKQAVRRLAQRILDQSDSAAGMGEGGRRRGAQEPPKAPGKRAPDLEKLLIPEPE
jgi:hypothetical protein